MTALKNDSDVNKQLRLIDANLHEHVDQKRPCLKKKKYKFPDLTVGFLSIKQMKKDFS